MIRFEPNGPSFTLANDQLSAVQELAGSEDARVIDLENTARIEVYVGDYYHEPIRHHVDVDGTVLLTEYDPNDNGEWQVTPE